MPVGQNAIALTPMQRFVVLPLFLGVAFAQAAASNATANATVLPLWQTCLRVNSVNDVCDVQGVCSRCVRTEGCGFDILQRECVELPPDGRAMYESSSNALLNRTNLTYCDDADPLCSSCSVSSSRPFCEGANACVCRSMCAVMRTSQLACYQMRQNNMMIISIAVIAVMLPILVWLQRCCARGRAANDNDIQNELRRMREQRMRELALRRRQRPPSALALQLESWRTHRDEHKMDVDRVELKDCYVLMENRGQPSSDQAVQSSSHFDNALSIIENNTSTRSEDPIAREESPVSHRPTEHSRVAM